MRGRLSFPTPSPSKKNQQTIPRAVFQWKTFVENFIPFHLRVTDKLM